MDKVAMVVRPSLHRHPPNCTVICGKMRGVKYRIKGAKGRENMGPYKSICNEQCGGDGEVSPCHSLLFHTVFHCFGIMREMIGHMYRCKGSRRYGPILIYI